MEFSLSGNALKTFSRSVTCLARISNELAIQASPLLAICSVLRTSISSIDVLNVQLPNPNASKVQWTLNCYNGVKKSYWITCNVEPDIQHLSLDRRKLSSNFVVRPRDLNRLLGNFQATLQEITIIATEPTALPPDEASEIGGKAVELRSYIDPTKDNDSSLHTQLWIDPAEEFVHYTHIGDPVDVTFGMKELKAFLSFCEACEIDMHIYFEKAGEPILMAPQFGLDDGSSSNFDTTIVLATMLASQLHSGTSTEPQAAGALHGQADQCLGVQAQDRSKGNTAEHPSDHTRIWSELSGSAVKSNNGAEDRQVRRERNGNTLEQREIQRIDALHISKDGASLEVPGVLRDEGPLVERNHMEQSQGRKQTNGQGSQHHPSNWVEADEDDDEADETDLCVQSTPPCYEE